MTGISLSEERQVQRFFLKVLIMMLHKDEVKMIFFGDIQVSVMSALIKAGYVFSFNRAERSGG